MVEYKIDTSELREYCGRLRAGDRVLLSGTVYTSRDAAHKRICALLDSGEELPFDLKDAAIYYAGPTPTNRVMLSAAAVRLLRAAWMFMRRGFSTRDFAA